MATGKKIYLFEEDVEDNCWSTIKVFAEEQNASRFLKMHKHQRNLRVSPIEVQESCPEYFRYAVKIDTDGKVYGTEDIGESIGNGAVECEMRGRKLMSCFCHPSGAKRITEGSFDFWFFPLFVVKMSASSPDEAEGIAMSLYEKMRGTAGTWADLLTSAGFDIQDYPATEI